MPYSESVSMNQDIPKTKGSLKWRRPKQSAGKTRFLEKPNFTSRTGKLVDVLYGPHHCNPRDDITLLCTYFEANKRHERLPKGSKSFVKNEISNVNFYSDKRKRRTTNIENEPSYMLQQYDKPSAKINAVLKDLGFVCNSDTMYTFYPSQICYYKDSQKHITRYGQKSYIAPKPKNSIGSSDGYNQNGRHQKPIRSKTYPENNRYNKNYKIEV
ncbi:uncharacterized protein LOC132951153 [Metopolophium dirhodum]|uniref:uncharacterized protein LOC132951153 n=1 Tax=Metopolophium dirhodum TaxID=44670 RepID=UPI00298FBE57|nr:uncharacterized protein LOC132951153 [Metopolophium dirhodum]